jgi:hypothetical protein
MLDRARTLALLRMPLAPIRMLGLVKTLTLAR